MRVFLWAAALAVLPVPAAAQRADSPAVQDTAAVAAELTRIAQALLDAVAAADTAVWGRYLADDALFTDEMGRTYTKAELLALMRPLPPGFSGTLRVSGPRMVARGDVAVLTYDALEDEEIFGQRIRTRYHTTDTFVRRDGGWRIIASQVQVLPGDPTPVAADPASYGAYVGRYLLGGDIVLEVARDGERLVMGPPGGEKDELLPLGGTRFFRRGRRGEVIFVADEQGRVTRMIQRRDNNDVVWRRVP